MSETKTHYGACNLCEAICGLEYQVSDNRIVSVRGDADDPFSKGHVCPKAVALRDIHEDPDRLRRPVKREGSNWIEISWKQAYKEVAEKLAGIRESYGSHSVAIYQGNPSVHNYGNLTHAQNFFGLLKTRNRFSATSVDQLPHQLLAHWMFGHQLLLPIPDIDRTQCFIVLGGNPMASNGSLMTVPDFRNRLKALQKRGGKMIVVDPRRTETAAVADEHHFIRPGTDAALLLAMLRTVFEEDLIQTASVPIHEEELEAIRELVSPFTPEAAAGATGIPAETILELTRSFSGTEKAVIYGRMGVSTQQFGTVCQWAINMLNLLTGHLDDIGGAMFTSPAVDLVARKSQPGHFNVWQSRVRNLPEFSGELPVAALAEEILTPGEGQIKALVTAAGNPCLSTPNGRQLDEALDQLDFMVSIDFYINETTRHADIILPPTCSVEHDHYDLIFHHLAVRNTAKYSPPVVKPEKNTQHDWQIFNGLASAYRKALGTEAPPLAKRVSRIAGRVKKNMRPDQITDIGLRLGPYGVWKSHPKALSIKTLKREPHGVDLGPLQAGLLPRKLQTEDQFVKCAIPAILESLPAVAETLLDSSRDLTELRLIGRRHVRSNNSWLHNSRRLVKGKRRDQLMIHADDAKKLELSDGDIAELSSRVGKVHVCIEITPDIMPGCVSLPHGWGHDRPGIRLATAQKHAGTSANDLTDDQFLDPVSGNAAVNGVSVTLARLAA